jgi:hypothetical protein
VARDLITPETSLDAAKVYTLVRDMPYRRASDRRPETIIAEWQGTCSGKHYLLKELFALLGLKARVMACTTITEVSPEVVPESQRRLYEAANRRFVDVHNFLLVSLPEGGEMQVDATWPLSVEKKGMKVNKTFELGKDQELAAEPLHTWSIPEDRDPQAFKQELLQTHFTPAELEFREEVIKFLGNHSA